MDFSDTLLATTLGMIIAGVFDRIVRHWLENRKNPNNPTSKDLIEFDEYCGLAGLKDAEKFHEEAVPKHLRHCIPFAVKYGRVEVVRVDGERGWKRFKPC